MAEVVCIGRAARVFTREALAAIAATTLENVTAFARGELLVNEVRAEAVRPRLA